MKCFTRQDMVQLQQLQLLILVLVVAWMTVTMTENKYRCNVKRFRILSYRIEVYNSHLSFFPYSVHPFFISVPK